MLLHVVLIGVLTGVLLIQESSAAPNEELTNQKADVRVQGHRAGTSSSPRIQRTPLPSRNVSSGISRLQCQEFYCWHLPTPWAELGLGMMGIVVEGGVDCDPNEFPHMAALGFRNPDTGVLMWNRCGGSLISLNHVLTAAHCVYGAYGAPQVIRLGGVNFTQMLERDQRKVGPRRRIQEIPVETVHVHPMYVEGHQQYNDIAVLKLAKTAYFRNNIRPGCLYDSPHVEEPAAVATGWGSTGFTEAASDILQKVTLDIIPHQRCRELLRVDTMIPEGVLDTQVCAGDLTGGHDTCTGDSGGPLQVNNTRDGRPGYLCPHLIVGITSFGRYCGEKNTPGVYTRVAPYVAWIESIVWPEVDEDETEIVEQNPKTDGDDTKMNEQKTKVKEAVRRKKRRKRRRKTTTHKPELEETQNYTEKPGLHDATPITTVAPVDKPSLFDLRRSDVKLSKDQV